MSAWSMALLFAPGRSTIDQHLTSKSNAGFNTFASPIVITSVVSSKLSLNKVGGAKIWISTLLYPVLNFVWFVLGSTSKSGENHSNWRAAALCPRGTTKSTSSVFLVLPSIIHAPPPTVA
ncbi:uncharacterized protein BDV14DRAFT_183086 [Aspergillus stella-maris]|uniref:uncharacterized protein n=1 Tax=Aspergillus stella-maris TaxID=1810926 RepID=UPI003CCD1CE4